ncbi:M23 family metallopeptidase [Sphingobium quisquiliarum]|nr:M23 family metallopeptidase [Sphingobium quisquiliarum]
MPYQFKRRAAALRAWIIALCPEREVALRSAGHLRSFRLSTRMQLVAAALLAGLALAWLAFTVSLVSARMEMARERTSLTAKKQAVEGAASKVDSYRQSIDALARDLRQRQDFIDDLYRTHFGEADGQPGDGATSSPVTQGAVEPRIPADASPQAAALLKIDARQRHFALRLTQAVEQRADRTAAAIRSFGLNPNALARRAAQAQGGPFVPWRGQGGDLPGEFEKLASALARMEGLESGLLSIPSGLPTAAPMQSSSYGYRRDPFNGHAAFHAGIDFPGRRGQPILAAAAGRIIFAGQRSGYGNVIEVEHGNGLTTRYAHLSAFAARAGQRVRRGDKIGLMGSTGRSTGDHLHFEVRMNGEAINPRRFLETPDDVIRAQKMARARFAEIGGRG